MFLTHRWVIGYMIKQTCYLMMIIIYDIIINWLSLVSQYHGNNDNFFLSETEMDLTLGSLILFSFVSL